ncbi:hypothetical protein J6590_028057 [Homalodisca vitripennis]|nr:hypothetical protein J6590_028057 [Homalodisca vitripennis]
MMGAVLQLGADGLLGRDAPLTRLDPLPRKHLCDDHGREQYRSPVAQDKYNDLLDDAEMFSFVRETARYLPTSDLRLENHNIPKHMSSDTELRKPA